VELFLYKIIPMNNFSTTAMLLRQLKDGDQSSCDKLFNLYQPALLKWAHGRIPAQAKGYMDTQDIVQDTLLLAFKNINSIRAQRPGAFFSYLRTVFINQIKQELRKNKPFQLSITQFNNDQKLSYEKDITTLIDYDSALDKVSEDEKEAIILRLEFGFSYDEIAQMTEKPSANSVRMYITRALIKLAGFMA
jgi:RNA polymerase sigma-70 factor (ECF subfamily)